MSWFAQLFVSEPGRVVDLLSHEEESSILVFI